MKFALILSGCGQHDGSETQEVILTLLSLAQEKIEWDAFAPDVMQYHVVNHLTNQPENGEQRNVLKESARLVRGKIKPITDADLAQYDAVIFPGGFGAVSNLCDWCDKGNDLTFHPDLQSFIDQLAVSKKPTGFICIAPVMIPKIFPGSHLTIGNDKKLADQITALGAKHTDCKPTDIIVDETHRVVSTPANMITCGINEVYEGIHKLVKALVQLAR
jgi:enhancing lycopene biosynthesis protein 2